FHPSSNANVDLRVILDTGSSDLIIVLPSDVAFNATGINVTNYFGDYSSIAGTIGFASVQMGNYTVASQGTLSFVLTQWISRKPLQPSITPLRCGIYITLCIEADTNQVQLGGILELGLDGIIGVSFADGQVSHLTTTLQENGMDPALGQPFLYNLFDQTPQLNNFIGISLSRSDDLEDSAEASFTINEVDEAYSAVAQAPQLPLFPGHNGRWSILVDGISVNGENISLPASTVPNAPVGKMVALMDTLTPTGALSPELVDAIYSMIPGSRYRLTDNGLAWTVPCNTTATVAIQISGQEFPIHPLDLSTVVLDAFSNIPACVCPFLQGQKDFEFDAIFGPSIMRNMYSV
ncbi:aspartic peptidase domain-containing protein, partial [Mycena vulgaris]